MTETARESSRQRQLGPRDRRDVAEVLEDLRHSTILQDRAARIQGQAIARSNEKLAAPEATMEAYRNGCATMEVNISTLGTYAQAVDARLTDVLSKATLSFRVLLLEPND